MWRNIDRILLGLPSTASGKKGKATFTAHKKVVQADGILIRYHWGFWTSLAANMLCRWKTPSCSPITHTKFLVYPRPQPYLTRLCRGDAYHRLDTLSAASDEASQALFTIYLITALIILLWRSCQARLRNVGWLEQLNWYLKS